MCDTNLNFQKKKTLQKHVLNISKNLQKHEIGKKPANPISLKSN